MANRGNRPPSVSYSPWKGKSWGVRFRCEDDPSADVEEDNFVRVELERDYYCQWQWRRYNKKLQATHFLNISFLAPLVPRTLSDTQVGLVTLAMTVIWE